MVTFEYNDIRSCNNALSSIAMHIPSPAEAARGRVFGAWLMDVVSAERYRTDEADGRASLRGNKIRVISYKLMGGNYYG